MGSGLGACEGSSARLPRLTSVVVSSLTMVAGSVKAKGLGISPPRIMSSMAGRSKEGALGHRVLVDQGCPEGHGRGNSQITPCHDFQLSGSCFSASYCGTSFWAT